MIVTRLIGGLGNQMFQYAAGRALAARLGVALKIDLHSFDTYALRQYDLNHLSIDAKKAGADECPDRAGYSIVRRLGRALGLTPKRTLRVYRERAFGFDPSVLALPDGTYLDGYWQSERYFADQVSLIRRHFTVRTPPSGANVEWLAKISSVNAVSMHVRRGDYASNPTTRDVHGLCAPEYYARAVELMVRTIGTDIEIFVFSDDPDWVRANLNFDYRTHFVIDNDLLHNYEDLRLMSTCRHHIIANSTFSWWGAWLCQDPGKVVISPKRWFSNATQDTADLIPSGWIRL